jgi:hypothetical protein
MRIIRNEWNPKEIVCWYVDRTQVLQGNDQWRPVVNTVIFFLVLKKMGNFYTLFTKYHDH